MLMYVNGREVKATEERGPREAGEARQRGEEYRVQIGSESPSVEVECEVCGWRGDRDDLRRIDVADDPDERRKYGEPGYACPACGDWLEHVPEPDPEDWCNSVAASIDHESVTASISLGDPRGAFTFSVRRRTDGRLLMHLPYPGASFQHAVPLTPLHPGTYGVGSGWGPEREGRASTLRGRLAALDTYRDSLDPIDFEETRATLDEMIREIGRDLSALAAG